MTRRQPASLRGLEIPPGARARDRVRRGHERGEAGGGVSLRDQIGDPVPGLPPTTRRFSMGSCSVIVGIEHGRWHISIAHPARYPKWDEIKAARMKYVPHNVTMALLLPGEHEYINVHPNCFHLYETRDL